MIDVFQACSREGTCRGFAYNKNTADAVCIMYTALGGAEPHVHAPRYASAHGWNFHKRRLTCRTKSATSTVSANIEVATLAAAGTPTLPTMLAPKNKNSTMTHLSANITQSVDFKQDDDSECWRINRKRGRRTMATIQETIKSGQALLSVP